MRIKEALGLDLAALAAFVAVGDKGDFRAAAEALGMSSAGVSKAVARIETQLGVMLVARTTRSVRLTHTWHMEDWFGWLHQMGAMGAAEETA